MLNRESGLLGISGASGDMREILSAMKGNHARAKLAFDIYVHRLQAGIGAMVAVLEELRCSCSPQVSGNIPLKCGTRHAAN